MKFLYISDDFPPVGMQGGIRALELSKNLVRENIFPIILTSRIEPDKLLNLHLIKEIPPEIIVYRTKYFEQKYTVFHNFDIFFNFLNYIKRIPFAYFLAKKIINENKEIKFIYASGPFFHTHIIGYLLKKKFKLPLVIEYRDPWSFNPYHIDKKWLNHKITPIIEKKILKSANIIITVSTALISFLKTNFRFVQNKKIYPIPNGLKLSKHQKKKININQLITLVFTGSLYGKRSIIPLFKIISSLKKENFFKKIPILIKIFGYYDGNSLENIVKKFDINDLISLNGLITRREALDKILNANLTIHIGEKVNYPTIAFKVWDYLSLRKKILYLGLEHSFTAKFLKKNNFGITIPINDLLKGKQILKNLLTKLVEHEFETFIDDFQLKDYTWNARSKDFINYVVKNI